MAISDKHAEDIWDLLKNAFQKILKKDNSGLDFDQLKR